MSGRGRRGWSAVLVAVALVTASLVAPPSGGAATTRPPTCTVTWTGPSRGGFENPAFWTPAHVPDVGDTACVGGGATVVVHGPSSVAGLVVDHATVLVPRASTVVRAVELWVLDGTLAGPGGFTEGDYFPSAWPVFSGTSSLTDGVQVTLPPLTGREANVSGTLDFVGGSLLQESVRAFDGAVLRSADDDPANRILGPGNLTTFGRVTIDVAVTGLAPRLGAGVVQLPRWGDVSPGGVLLVPPSTNATFGSFIQADTVVPVPITQVAAGSELGFNVSGTLTAASTGRSAWESLAGVAGNLALAGRVDDTVPLGITGHFVVNGTLEAPAVRATTGFLGIVGRVSVRQGRGTMTVGSGGCGLDGVLSGAVSVSTGRLDLAYGAAPGRITRDLTLGARSATSAGIYPVAADPATPRLAVGGRATLGGTLTVTFGSQVPATTGRIALVTAGSVVGRYAATVVPTGWYVEYTTTAVDLVRDPDGVAR